MFLVCPSIHHHYFMVIRTIGHGYNRLLNNRLQPDDLKMTGKAWHMYGKSCISCQFYHVETSKSTETMLNSN